MNKRLIIAALAATLVVGAALPAFAQDDDSQTPSGNWGHNGQWQGGGPGMMGTSVGVGLGMSMRPAVVGTVTAVNGSTITVVSTGGFGRMQGTFNQGTTTFTVDASQATIYKDNATSTIGSVSINDRIFVVGSVSGTNVTATIIRDGMTPNPRRGGPMMNGYASSSPFQGNGQPVVAGTVSSVSGSSITITTSSNTSFTIDAPGAKLLKAGATVSISSISTGDYVVVQGTVNGSNVTASTVLDQGTNPQGPGMMAGNTDEPPRAHGFFASIRNFFRHIFGF